MISTKILFSLSIITVFAIASKAKIIKGGDARDIKEREEMVMDDSDRVKSLSWLSNRRFDYENTPEHFITTNKRGMFKIANEKKTEVKPDPVYVNRLKDFIYRADSKSKQKVLYVSCSYIALIY